MVSLESTPLGRILPKDEPVFRNQFVSVLPAGEEEIAITVGTGHGAVALVRWKDKVLLVNQPRYATNEMAWELPRATSLEDESPVETAARCVEGWSGVSVDQDSAIPVGTVMPDAEILTNEVSLFVMDAESGTIRVNRDNARWVEIEELVTACTDGQVEDAFTCMTVLRARLGKLI